MIRKTKWFFTKKSREWFINSKLEFKCYYTPLIKHYSLFRYGVSFLIGY